MSAMMKLLHSRLGLMVVILALCGSAHADDPGVSASEVVLGQSAILSGSVGAFTAPTVAGANRYFQSVNERGGVHGRKIRLVTLDNGFTKAGGEANAAELADKHGVFAFFGIAGTGPALAVFAKAKESNTPVFGIFSGNDALLSVYRHAYWVRPPYSEEIRYVVQQLSTLGTNRVAVVAQDDAFGRDAAKIALAGIKSQNMPDPKVWMVKPDRSDLASALTAVVASDAQSILLLTAGAISIEAVDRLANLSNGRPIYGLSVFGMEEVIEKLGPKSRGVIIAQVYPNPFQPKNPLVAEYHAMTPEAARSFRDFEGFVTARAFVEMLRRCGPALTRRKFIETIEGTTDLNLGGGMRLGYVGRSYGSKAINLSIVGPQGRVMQ